MRFDLNGEWLMTDVLGEKTTGRIPGSVYSFLLDAGKMEDPYAFFAEDPGRIIIIRIQEPAYFTGPVVPDPGCS